ncbi:hypothetical protein [Zunongwangia profunda]|uniref:hypothetical protein n=1 Tax=Zunongwangia profunda TaxID=398743 RepID=UPI001D17F14B|nr:hypothetical protein [Zunongwangia profunda]MCC4228415.1 hypothetical protein [Zunongwangia profunda]
MKGVITSFIVFFLFTNTYTIFSQERVNKENLKFKENIGELLSAKGWEYNTSTGDWVGYNNLIEGDARWKDENTDDASDYIKSHREQNFIKLEFKTIEYKNEIYYVLLVSKWNGRYNYPAIRKDWITFKQLEGFIYTEEQFNELKSFEKEIDLVTINQISTHIDDDYTIQDPLDRIQYTLEHIQERSKYASKYLFPVRISDEGLIRFLIPDIKSSYKENYDFSKYYFEITMEDWNKLIGK